MEFGDYIVFVDESGDHNLEVVNPEYPLFILALCVFKKSDYIHSICPKVQGFKLHWFGHDSVVLHEREITRDLPPFQFLKSRETKSQFMNELTAIIDASPVTIIPTVINKQALKKKYMWPHNPYHLALFFGLERLASFLEVHGQSEKLTHVIFEQRGGKKNGGEEDRTLELEFRRILDGQNPLSTKPLSGMEIQIVPKSANSIGLQIADLVARPIGLKCLRPQQENRAFDIIRKKFLEKGNGYIDYGIKQFP